MICVAKIDDHELLFTFRFERPRGLDSIMCRKIKKLTDSFFRRQEERNLMCSFGKLQFDASICLEGVCPMAAVRNFAN